MNFISPPVSGGQHLWMAASTVDDPRLGPEASLRKQGQEHGHYKATLSFPSTKPGHQQLADREMCLDYNSQKTCFGGPRSTLRVLLPLQASLRDRLGTTLPPEKTSADALSLAHLSQAA